MATPPFNIDESKPADNDPVSAYPTVERAFRDIVEDSLAVEHDFNSAGSSARHKFGVGANAARDAITDWVVGSIWFNTSTTPVTLQRVVSVGPVVWENVTALGNLLSTANTFTAQQSVVLASGTSTLILQTNDAGATGPVATLYHNSASPAANDLAGAINTQGNSSTGVARTLGQVAVDYLDPTNTSEDARVRFGSIVAGTFTIRAYIGAGIYTVGATGGDKGADTINAEAYYKRGAGSVVMLVQSVTLSTATFSDDLTTVIPDDDTIPTSSEGTQVFSQPFTPKHASSTIIIRVEAHVGDEGTNGFGTLAVFNGTTCVRANGFRILASEMHARTLYHEEAAASTSARTYSLRIGKDNATAWNLNGKASARVYGGVLLTQMVIEEWL